jgi:hypothetical protein
MTPKETHNFRNKILFYFLIFGDISVDLVIWMLLFLREIYDSLAYFNILRLDLSNLETLHKPMSIRTLI